MQLLDTLQRKPIELILNWMPSRARTDPEKPKKTHAWMEDWHIKGNNQAHTLAGGDADMHSAPPAMAKTIIDKIDASYRIDLLR